MNTVIFPTSMQWKITPALIEFLVHIIAYSSVVGFHTRHTVVSYSSKFGKSSNVPLVLHIAAGLFEVFRFDFRSLHGVPVQPDGLDLIACLFQSVTNMYLVKTLLRGDKYITRPSYQTAGLMRPLLCVAAFVLGDPVLHRASVKLVNAFVYTRTIVFMLCHFDILRDSTYSTFYTIAVFLGAVLAVAEGNLPGAVLVYVIAVVGIALLNKWVSREVIQRNEQSSTPPGFGRRLLVDILVTIGLVEIDALRAAQKQPALLKRITDYYIERSDKKEENIDQP